MRASESWTLLPLACLLVSTTALAAEPEVSAEAPDILDGRAPVEPADQRAHTLSFDRYHEALEVERPRTDGKEFATFSAEPQLIQPGAQVVLEIRSEAEAGSVLRWRCVAVHDVAECLGAPVRVRYLPEDARIVLTMRFLPRRVPGWVMASL